jgi:murein DD-endopeptidase MepM/ murein hydrolase activator NlpD
MKTLVGCLSVLLCLFVSQGRATAADAVLKLVQPLKQTIIPEVGPKTILYAPVGTTSEAKIAIEFLVTNKGTTTLRIDRVEFLGRVVAKYKATEVQSGQTIALLAGHRREDSSGAATEARAGVFNLPIPAQAELAVYFENDPIPVTSSFLLEAHQNVGELGFPAHAADLQENEVWKVGAHIDPPCGRNRFGGGCDQAFALDTIVQVWDPNNNSWQSDYPGTDTNSVDAKPEQSRSYGRPIYAPRDGSICLAVNDHPEWSHLTGRKNEESFPVSPSLGQFLGGGNVVILRSGNELSIFAHLQPGSIPPEYLVAGTQVKKGQYIGKLGLSGSTSGPHMHFDTKPFNTRTIVQRPNCDPPSFLPTGIVGASSRIKLNEDTTTTLANGWNSLAGKTWSDKEGILYPSAEAPKFCSSCTDELKHSGVWRAGSDIQVRLKLPVWESFQRRWTEMTKDSFRLIRVKTVNENGSRKFIGLFNRGGGNHSLVQEIGWDAFLTKTETLAAQGLQIVDVTSYWEGTEQIFVAAYQESTQRHQVRSASGWESFVQNWDELGQLGFRLISIDTLDQGDGTIIFTGVFSPGTGQILWLLEKSAFLTKAAETASENFRLVALDTYRFEDQEYYVGVFHPGTDKHEFKETEGYGLFSQVAEGFNRQGLRLVDVAVEPDDKIQQYNGWELFRRVWSRKGLLGTVEYVFWPPLPTTPPPRPFRIGGNL